jgi:hypothetical protein
MINLNMTITTTRISFCVSDNKRQFYSFDLNNWTEVNGSINYYHNNRYDGYKPRSNQNEFYSLNKIFNKIEKFDLIIEAVYEANNLLSVRFIQPGIVDFESEDKGENVYESTNKLERLLIKPKKIWTFDPTQLDDEQFFDLVTPIRREIKLNKIGI